MTGSAVLDVLLVLLLLAFLAYGYSTGFVRSLSGILGIVAGGIAAFFVVPFVGSWIPAPEWRTPATLAVALLLLFGGLSIGTTIGFALRRQVDKVKLGILDRLLGAATTFVASALVISMLAFSIGALGVPMLSSAIASSGVIRTIEGLTPGPVKGFLAQARAVVTQEGLPQIVDAFRGPMPEIPQFDTGSPALAAAAQSVVRITGNAYACGQNQSGSGFVVAPDRIITNAHVVAGVTEPIVEAPGLGALPGTVVYFDPVDDLAVIAVDGLAAPPLQLTPDLARGSRAVTHGYPFGGPFDSDPAEVISVSTLRVANIYGEDAAPREVYTLAADVQQGESGGPLLSEAGLVVGVIFAKAATTPNVGYALTMTELEPVASQAPTLDATVPSGNCTQQ